MAKNKMGGTSGAIYGLGFLGALVYYFQHSASLLDVLLGVLKAALWPAFLIYKVIGLLGI